MQFIITAKTTLTFKDGFIEDNGISLDEAKEKFKEVFEKLLADEIGPPDGDFLGYSLSVDVETVDMAEVEEILEREG